jgi:hypothetical protein
MPTVFLSYRRSDTGGQAGRLADSFEHRLGTDITFRDATDIPAGASFEAILQREVAACDTVLVLIGPSWLEDLNRRLQQPEKDYVRVEIANALVAGKRIIPLLINGAALPSRDSLPDDIRGLVDRQAITLRDESWAQDVERLLDSIGRPYAWKWLVLRCAIASALILAGVWLAVPRLPITANDQLGYARALVVALIALYAVIEIALALRRHAAMKHAR